MAKLDFAKTKAQKDLSFSGQFSLKDLINSMDYGVLLFNSDRNIIAANPMFKRYLDLADVGSSLNKFINIFEKRYPGIKADFNIGFLINEVIKNARPIHMQAVHLGTMVLEISIIPIRDYNSEVTGGAILLHDITRLKEIDDMKSEFVSVASHQLRTPLTAIKLFVEMILSNEVGDLTADQRDYLNNIQESSTRMTRLVNNLLNVSRIESDRLRIDPTPTDLVKFVKEIIAETKPFSDMRHCGLRFINSAEKIAKIKVDQVLLHQVVSNFISNAINYSRNNCGSIEIAIYSDRSFKGLNKKTIIEPGLIISVKDDGIGIPKKSQEKIFQKFFRADNAVKSATEGSGLGMYIAKMVIEVSGGKIWFESQENKGTTFYIFIPKTGMKKKAGEKPLIA